MSRIENSIKQWFFNMDKTINVKLLLKCHTWLPLTDSLSTLAQPYYSPIATPHITNTFKQKNIHTKMILIAKALALKILTEISMFYWKLWATLCCTDIDKVIFFCLSEYDKLLQSTNAISQAKPSGLIYIFLSLLCLSY